MRPNAYCVPMRHPVRAQCAKRHPCTCRTRPIVIRVVVVLCVQQMSHGCVGLSCHVFSIRSQYHSKHLARLEVRERDETQITDREPLNPHPSKHRARCDTVPCVHNHDSRRGQHGPRPRRTTSPEMPMTRHGTAMRAVTFLLMRLGSRRSGRTSGHPRRCSRRRRIWAGTAAPRWWPPWRPRRRR